MANEHEGGKAGAFMIALAVGWLLFLAVAPFLLPAPVVVTSRAPSDAGVEE